MSGRGRDGRGGGRKSESEGFCSAARLGHGKEVFRNERARVGEWAGAGG